MNKNKDFRFLLPEFKGKNSGSTVRKNKTLSIPIDNPLIIRKGAFAELYYGIRRAVIVYVPGFISISSV